MAPRLCVRGKNIVYVIPALVQCYRVSNIFESFSNLRYPKLHCMLPIAIPHFPAILIYSFLVMLEGKNKKKFLSFPFTYPMTRALSKAMC